MLEGREEERGGLCIDITGACTSKAAFNISLFGIQVCVCLLERRDSMHMSVCEHFIMHKRNAISLFIRARCAV